MKRLTRVFAISVAGAMLATVAYAQSTTTPPSATDSTTKETPSATESMKDRATDMKNKMKSRAHRTMDRAKNGMAGNRDDVMAVQQALKDKGHDPGAIDGVMGPKTRQAVRDFQQKEGLQATGRLDAGTRDKLGVQARTSSTDTSSPSASPATGGPSTGAATDSSPTGSGTGGGTASGPMSTPPISEKDAARDASKTPSGTTKQPATR